MVTNPSVNRYLKDKAMDYIDHALGRPVNPMEESYRNYFYTGAGDEIGFDGNPYWKQSASGYYHVTEAGRKALRQHLHDLGSKHRLFIVTFDGMEMSEVAKTHSEARYLKWLGVRDSYEISFGEFAKNSKVRVAMRKGGE